MKQIDEHRFQADEKQTFVHKSTGKRMGNGLYIADGDSIENYSEGPMTEAEITAIEEAQQKREREREARLKETKKTHKK